MNEYDIVIHIKENEDNYACCIQSEADVPAGVLLVSACHLVEAVRGAMGVSPEVISFSICELLKQLMNDKEEE